MSIYYNPEEHDLTIVGTVAFVDSYEHDYFTVWKNANGEFAWGTSAGCSCYSPFEEDAPEDLNWGSINEIKAGFEQTLELQFCTPEEKAGFQLQFISLFTRMIFGS